MKKRTQDEIQLVAPTRGGSNDAESILDYPDAALVESGNRHLSTEADFHDMTIIADDRGSFQGGDGKPAKHVRLGSNSGEIATEVPPEPVATVWDAPELEILSDPNPWGSKTTSQRFLTVGMVTLKVLGVILLLYFFICGLDIMSQGLRLIAGKTAGQLFGRREVLQNPIAGVMIALLFTVLVQSSSTSTSIIVNLVSTSLREAIPMVMGANIGTSITNTFVAFGQVRDKSQFQRAFAGATIHDLFNALTTIVLLTLEITTHYLELLTGAIVSGVKKGTEAKKYEFLHHITKPLTEKIVKTDSDTLKCFANPECSNKLESQNLRLMCTNVKKCSHMFVMTKMSDNQVGWLLFVLSIIAISLCLVGVVKLLKSVLAGPVARTIKRTMDTEIPYVPFLKGYLAICLGTFFTFIMQSSSVFTSALTPLVGLGVIRLQIMYPLTLGANVGTTGTAILAAFAVSSDKLKNSLQIALCHFFFNISGIVIFYPIPFMRWPIYFAMKLGKATASYRWLAVVYIIGSFGVIPGILLGLSVIHPYASMIFAVFCVLFFAFVIIVNVLQNRHVERLPKFLQDWECLPRPLRSLEPYDQLFGKCPCCRKCCKAGVNSRTNSVITVLVNKHEGGDINAPKPSTISLVSFRMTPMEQRSLSKDHVAVVQSGNK